MTMGTKRLMDVTRLSPKEGAPNTRTLSLYKVEDGRTIHIVWHDRYGWYCEMADHGGRDCPAVAEARAYEQEKR